MNKKIRTRYKMRFFIANKKVNNCMEQADLKPPHKCFISEVRTVSFETMRKVDSRYILRIISLLKNDVDYWVPAIEFNGQLYTSPGIKELSDGQTNYYVKSSKGIQKSKRC